MKIINGDSIEEMKKMTNESFDILFTSPPFKDEDVAPMNYWEFYDNFFKEATRITKKVVVIIHSSTKMNEVVAKYPPKRTLIWGKGIIQPSYRYNPIFVYQISDDYKVNKYIWSDTIGVEPIRGSDKIHKYQDPLILYETVLKMFSGCSSVIDPFMGSGTTGAACSNLGLDFTGIEIDESYFAVASKRLDDYLEVFA